MPEKKNIFFFFFRKKKGGMIIEQETKSHCESYSDHSLPEQFWTIPAIPVDRMMRPFLTC